MVQIIFICQKTWSLGNMVLFPGMYVENTLLNVGLISLKTTYPTLVWVSTGMIKKLFWKMTLLLAKSNFLVIEDKETIK